MLRKLRNVFTNSPVREALGAYLNRAGVHVLETYPRGHHYSPLPEYPDAEQGPSVPEGDELAGIELRTADQLCLFQELAQHALDFPFPSTPQSDFRCVVPNPMLGEGDAMMLYAMLCRFQPRRVIEVGSGYSSALILDTRDRVRGSALELTCIEPYPQRLLSLLRPEDCVRVELRREPVQSVPPALFDQLAANDILFIDSSHVAKKGSDVNHLLFNILPKLAKGTVVHFHDIHWPFEYPLAWLNEGRAWNEAYVVRAFLQHNSAFEIILFNSYLGSRHSEYARQLLPRFLNNPGGSLWLRKTA